MATIVRVKRHRAEDPASALLVACKRLKQSEDLDEVPSLVEEKNLLNFAGTVSSKNEPVIHVVQKALRQAVAQNKNPKSRVIDIHSKLRNEYKISADKNRFKLVNTHRGIDVTELANAAEAKDVTEAEAKLLYNIFDVVEDHSEKQDVKAKCKTEKLEEITCNGEPMIRHVIPQTEKHEADYVYDLYVTKGVSFDDDDVLQQTISIEKYLDPVVNFTEDEEHVCDDDEDSNDENYYKNDYPEEDSDFENDIDYWGDYDDEKMVQHFSNCRIDTNSDEESFVDDGCTSEDIWTHGSAYAQYRIKKMNEL